MKPTAERKTRTRSSSSQVRKKPTRRTTSVREAIRALVDARFDSLLTDVGDVLGPQLNFLIGVEVGRRIGGAR